jgi:RHS repeat-associated protein
MASAADTYNYTGTDVASSGAGPDAPTSISTLAQTSSPLAYDYSGRVISKYGGAEQLTYDVLGRLTSVTRANDVGEVLTYDPAGQVVGRLSGATLTYYIGKVATVTTPAPVGCTVPGCASDPSATVTVDVHLVVGGRRLASIRALASGIGRILYYYRDRLGSVVATSTTGGVPGATYRYDPYGDLTTSQGDSGASASELGFTGKVRLSRGLYLMGNRVYDAKLRQFLQPDLQNPMSYTYAGGDPVNFVDPTGRSPQASRESSEAPIPGVDAPHPGGGGGGGIQVFFEGSWKDIKKIPGKIGEWAGDAVSWILDAATKTWDTVTSCFGLCGGSSAPAPREPPHIRVVNTGAPSQGAGNWWFSQWGNWGGSRGGPTAGQDFPGWIKDFSKSFEKCAYCGKDTPYERLHLDHVDPKVNGGNSQFPNNAPACVECNLLKGPLSGPALQMLMVWLQMMKGVVIVAPDAGNFERSALEPFPGCSGPRCDL